MDRYDLEVINSLREMEIGAHMRGYEYLKTAMTILKDHPLAIHNMMNLYKTVAEKHGTKASGVERGIRHALGNADSDFITQKKVIGTARDLSNSEFLATLAEAIRIKLSVEGEA